MLSPLSNDVEYTRIYAFNIILVIRLLVGGFFAKYGKNLENLLLLNQ